MAKAQERERERERERAREKERVRRRKDGEQNDPAWWLAGKPKYDRVVLKNGKRRNKEKKINPCLKIKPLIRHAKKATSNGWRINI